MAGFSKMWFSRFRSQVSSSIYSQFRYRKPHQSWQPQESNTKFRRNLWLMNGGILLTVFAGCYLVVPLYKQFCQTTGLVGDDMQKDYSKVIKDGKKRETDPDLDWSFEPEQEHVTVHAGEPALMFYKTLNKSDKPLVGIALYSVFPEDAGYYFSKIQCFCFNQQVLNGREELQMPLYFYLEPEIDDDRLLNKTKDITIIYKFYLAKNQDLAKWMESQQKWEYEQKSFLRKKRIEKAKEDGASTLELENDQSIEDAQIGVLGSDYKFGIAKPNDITQFKHKSV